MSKVNYTEDGKLSVSLEVSEKTLDDIVGCRRKELWVAASYTSMDKFSDEYAMPGSDRRVQDFVTTDGEHWGGRTLKDVGEVRLFVRASSKRLWANVWVKRITYEGRRSRYTDGEVRPYIILHLGAVSAHN